MLFYLSGSTLSFGTAKHKSSFIKLLLQASMLRHSYPIYWAYSASKFQLHIPDPEDAKHLQTLHVPSWVCNLQNVQRHISLLGCNIVKLEKCNVMTQLAVDSLYHAKCHGRQTKNLKLAPRQKAVSQNDPRTSGLYDLLYREMRLTRRMMSQNDLKLKSV